VVELKALNVVIEFAELKANQMIFLLTHHFLESKLQLLGGGST
jgi:hypothetical protein